MAAFAFTISSLFLSNTFKSSLTSEIKFLLSKKEFCKFKYIFMDTEKKIVSRLNPQNLLQSKILLIERTKYNFH